MGNKFILLKNLNEKFLRTIQMFYWTKLIDGNNYSLLLKRSKLKIKDRFLIIDY